MCNCFKTTCLFSRAQNASQNTSQNTSHPRISRRPESQKKRKHTVIAFFGYTSRYCILGHVYTMCQGRSFPKGKTLFFFIVSFSLLFGQSCRKTCERWAPSICQEPFRATQETRNKKQRKYKHRFIVWLWDPQKNQENITHTSTHPSAWQIGLSREFPMVYTIIYIQKNICMRNNVSCAGSFVHFRN